MAYSSIELINTLLRGSEEEQRLLARTVLAVNEHVNVIVDGPPTLLGELPCRVSTLSVDGRGRAQKQVRMRATRVNFRPWHLAWAGMFGEIPVGLQYSHRCPEENCIEPSHGVWESDHDNKDRWSCRLASHVLVDGKVHRLCKHKPVCFNGVRLQEGDDGYDVATI
eukprot:c1432_g1_i1.p1 GENE.c1432_g1_i1~~c1432_g1_i1.p1  ORF type:complete len:166 (+),score=12.58 c1432_g1_i1:52-549(+)